MAYNVIDGHPLREEQMSVDLAHNQPNPETATAMLEAERIAKDPNVKKYTDLDELFADLKT